MKRIFALLVVAAVSLTVGACSPDENNRQQSAAAQAFDHAYQQLAQVNAGYIDNRLLKQPVPGITLRDYQRQLLRQAIDELAPLTTAGSSSQQVTATLALANAHAMLARLDASDALHAAANLTALSDQAVATLVAARTGQTQADANNMIRNDDAFDSARRTQGSLQDQQERLSQEIGSLAKQIEKIDSDVADLAKQRDAAMKKSADLRARAFGSTGQMRFDLHTQSSEQVLNADKLSGKIDLLNIERNKLDALRQIATIQKQQIDSKLEAAQRSINELTQQRQTLDHNAKAGVDAANTAADNLLAQLQGTGKLYNEDVVARFSAACDHLEQAVKALGAAVSKDGSQTDLVKLQYAAAQAELGHLLRQSAVLYQGNADLLKLIADRSGQGFPGPQGEKVQLLAQAAADKAKAADADATAALNTAEQLLTQAAGSASGQAKTAANRQLELVREAISSKTSESTPG